MSKILSSETKFATHKNARVAIINGDNYGQWAQSMEAALAGVSALGIVLGTEEVPAARAATYENWRIRRDLAMQLLVISIPPEFGSYIRVAVREQNPQGIWEAMKTFDKSTQPAFASTAREHFQSQQFHPGQETIRQFVAKLRKFQVELELTNTPINDGDLQARMLASLPSDPQWQNVKLMAQFRQHTFEEVVNMLVVVEGNMASQLKPSTAANSAVNSASSSRNSSPHRGRGRGKRGRWNRDNDRSRSSSRKLDSNQCRFCFKQGHREADCRKKMQIVEENAKKEESSGKVIPKQESAHSAIVVEEYDDGSIYSSFYASESANSGSIRHERWIIDSGASKHFSHNISDFRRIKRWSTPKAVRTADGTLCEAEGYGDIEIKISVDKSLVLRDAWYLPTFKCKLISVAELNKDNISVLFERAQATGFKLRNEVFIAHSMEGQYILNIDQTAFAGQMGENQENESWDLAHRRLGHRNPSDMNKLINGGAIGLKYRPKHHSVADTICEPCLAGKMKLKYHKTTEARENRKIRRLHVDLSGIQAPSVRGYRYYLCIIDDATRVGWVRLTRTKSSQEILPILQQLKEMVERETGEKAVFWRTMNLSLGGGKPQCICRST